MFCPLPSVFHSLLLLKNAHNQQGRSRTQNRQGSEQPGFPYPGTVYRTHGQCIVNFSVLYYWWNLLEVGARGYVLIQFEFNSVQGIFADVLVSLTCTWHESLQLCLYNLSHLGKALK